VCPQRQMAQDEAVGGHCLVPSRLAVGAAGLTQGLLDLVAVLAGIASAEVSIGDHVNDLLRGLREPRWPRRHGTPAIRLHGVRVPTALLVR